MPSCPIQNLSIDGCITQGFPIYNEYADLFLRPDLRKEAIVTRDNIPNFMMYMYDLRSSMLKSGYREVTTRKYLWQEMIVADPPFQFTIDAEPSAGAAGADVVATINRPYTDGYTSPPVGVRAFTQMGGEITTVIIQAISGDQITLRPINNQALDFRYRQFTFKFNPNIAYDKSCTGEIDTNGIIQTQVPIAQGVIQEYEQGKCICQDALSHYGYDFIPQVMQMVDPMNPKVKIDTWCLPEAIAKLVREEQFFGEFIEMLVGSYNMVTDTGTDGLLTSVMKRGRFNRPINAGNTNSMLATLRSMALEYHKIGINGMEIWCDLEMYMNINNAMSRIPGNNNFNLPIWSGSAQGMLNWYGFTGIENAFGIKGFTIKLNTFTGWEQMGLDNSIMRNFGLVMPDMTFSTPEGRVPAVEIVKLRGCEGWKIGDTNGNGLSLWYDDARLRGGRSVRIFSRNQFGIDFHGLPLMGILSGSCQLPS